MNISSRILLLTALAAVYVEANCAETAPNKNQNNPLKLQRIIDQSTQGKATSCLIFNDEMRILPVSNYDSFNDLYYGFPAVVGRAGIIRRLDLKLSEKEGIKLQESINAIKKATQSVYR